MLPAVSFSIYKAPGISIKCRFCKGPLPCCAQHLARHLSGLRPVVPFHSHGDMLVCIPISIVALICRLCGVLLC